MRILMSYSGGTYRGIQLSSEFQKKGLLEKLFLPYYSQRYPLLTKMLGRFEDKQYIDNKLIETDLFSVLYRKLLHKTCGYRNTTSMKDRYLIAEMIDKRVAKRLSKCQADIFIGESHQALYSIRAAKENGMVTFLDRTNAHIKIQECIDTEEFEKFGLPTWHYGKDVEKGLKEYEEVDHIIVPSSFVQRGFMQEGVDPNKIICVSPGIDLTHFIQEAKNDSVFRIIYCGGISHRKGVFYLLEAMASLNLKNAELWLIGNIAAGMSEILKQFEGYYKHIGFVANYELSKYFSQGSVFVLPSLEDSFGKVIVEAMACGLPAIVTTNTAAEDVVSEGKDGFIVPIRDVEALKEKILYLYENQSICKEMGRRAKENIQEKATLHGYADRMIQTLVTALHERVPGSLV